MEKKRFYLLLVIFLLILASVGISLAFFVGEVFGGNNSNVDVDTEGVASINFSSGIPINLVAHQGNFGEGDGSLSADTTTTVTYNGKFGTSETYDVRYKVISNSFVYTQDEFTPEIILKITGPSGEINTIDGLDYVTVADSLNSKTITGFDITDFVGEVLVAEDFVISGSGAATTQNWKAEMYMINLDADQVLNEGKSLESNFIVGK